ncbi:MAG: PBECR2 nuclease fold domain-containing protein [Nanoarchaeota archaeon]
MDYIFEIIDKSGRRIHLSKERWKHIIKKHPEVEEYELIKETIEKPDKITQYHKDETIYYFYKYYKHKPVFKKYLLVVVKYLNKEGYVLSAYFENKII